MSETLNKVDELLANRRNCIAALEQAAAKATEARSVLTRAEEELAAAWAVANDTGWSSKELDQLGFTDPTSQRPVRKRTTSRPRAAKQPGSPNSAQTPAPSPVGELNTDEVQR